MSFADLVKYLGSAAALAAVSSILLQLLRKAWPKVDENIAFVLSILFAAGISIGAKATIPYLSKLPPEVEDAWPVVVWALQQVWWRLFHTANISIYRTKKAENSCCS